MKDFHRVVVENIPLIDVRAPVEFDAGSFPMAANLPLMDNEDRHIVGLCYKQQGKEAAFNLALKRVSGSKKEERIAAWIEFVDRHTDALCYCFRGGMRSKTTQLWFEQATGRLLPRLEGGYKAFRRYLIEQMEPSSIPAIPVILGGRTGTGKTILLRQVVSSIDLEDLANHRGSAFGRYLSPQPSQIDFENRLACALVRHRHQSYKHLVLEDEGSYIGRRYIPKDLVRYFQRDSMVILERSISDRVEITFKEYVNGAQQEYSDFYGANSGLSVWFEDVQASVGRIKKRLGGVRFKQVMEMLAAAHEQQQQSGDPSLHKKWLELLLWEYYDPMYDYQIEKSNRTIQFKGDYHEVLQYLQTLAEERFH